MRLTAGSTNKSVYMYAVEDVGGTNPGEPKTGLLFSDIETGGSGSFIRQGAARVDITLITQTVAGVHADGGFVEVDATNSPGVYRFDPPDAAWVAGIDSVIIALVAAAANNCIFTPKEIDITDVDLRNATSAGLSRLDAAITTRLAPTVASRTLDVTTGGNAGLDWGNIVNKTTTNILSGTTIGTVTAFSTAAILSIWDQLTAALSTASTIGKLLVDNINATITSRLAPTTAGRTLDVTTGGAAGLDWGNIENKATANNLSGTDIQLVGTTSVNSDMRGTDGVDTATMRGTDGVDTATMRGTDNALLASSAPTNFGDLAITASTGRIDVGLWLGNAVTASGGVPDVNIQSTDNIALSDQQKLDVNVEAKDVLFTDTDPEPGQGTPGATIPVASKIGFLYKNWRNEKRTTSSQFSLLGDDAATVDQKAVVSDDLTTAIKEEMVTGP